MAQKRKPQFFWIDPNPLGAVEQRLEQLFVGRLLDGHAELTNRGEDGKIKCDKAGEPG